MSARIESKAQKPVGAQEGPVAILLRLKDAGQVYVLSKAATLRRNSGFRWDSVPGCVLSGLFWRIDRKYEQNFRTITLPDQPSLCSGPGCATASTLPTAIQRSSARPRIDPVGLGSLGLDLGLELCLDLDLGATSTAAGQ